MKFKIKFLFITLLLGACQMKAVENTQSPADPFLWLEEVEAPKALDFAKVENQKTLTHFKSKPLFTEIEKEVRAIALAKDRIPAVRISNGMLYNFWQDEVHVRGIWRRTSIAEFKKAQPKWELLLDLDALAKAENENWVWKGEDSLAPAHERTLIHLSRGGKDAIVLREFDKRTKTFVQDGFVTTEAKTYAAWKDENSIYIGTDYGPGTLTDSGYPMVTKLWQRGTPLSEAKEILRGQKSDVYMATNVEIKPEGGYVFHLRRITFYSGEVWYETPDGKTTLIPMPQDADLSGVQDGYAFFSLRTDFGSFKTGSLVALDLERFLKDPTVIKDSLSLVFEPTEKTFLDGGSSTRDGIYLNVMDNILNRIVKVERKISGGLPVWHLKKLPLGKNGMASFGSGDSAGDQFIAHYYDFLTPTSIYLGSKNDQFELLKSAPSRFKSEGLHVERASVKSKDGTVIPYFIVSRKELKKDASNPTLLYGYGGFEVSMQPSYLSITGKVWLERGGVYVLANLRGGGEFGPAWHRAVIKENRYKVYEDFSAIAEDLIAKKITSPKHLGIKGGSNGGLLVGATAMLRPELFNAVLCQVPLLDMLRYHTLLAGASWMGEYGNPDVSTEREYILKYSPYQKVSGEKKYPEIFFMTSTKDDRVHPAHARKMVAKMKSLGHPVYYYENLEGGHAGNANIEQTILWNSLEYTYLFEKLRR